MDSEMSDGTPVSPRLDARMLADLREWRAHHGTGLRHIALTIGEVDMLLRVAAERDTLKAAACEMPDERTSNTTPIRREAKIHGEFVTMRVDDWRRVTDELSRLRTAEAARIDAALEEDERVIAWKQIADHPFFRECYGAETSLLEAMLAKLTDSTFEAEIPAEVRERAAVLPAGYAIIGGVVVPLPSEPAMRTPGVCSRCGGSIYYSVPSHAWVHSGAVPEDCVPRPTPKRAAEKREHGPSKACTRCNGRGGLPYDGPCPDCLGTGSTPA